MWVLGLPLLLVVFTSTSIRNQDWHLNI
jgi:hypothetical protein